MITTSVSRPAPQPEARSSFVVGNSDHEDTAWLDIVDDPIRKSTHPKNTDIAIERSTEVGVVRNQTQRS